LGGVSLRGWGNLKAFVRAYRAQMFAAMSGGFSVPFTYAAVYSDSKYGYFIYGCLALAAFVFAAFAVWKIEHDKVLVLGKAFPLSGPCRIF
jgi:hypothetical protein